MLNNDDSPFLLLVAVPTQGQLRQCHFHAGKQSGQSACCWSDEQGERYVWRTASDP